MQKIELCFATGGNTLLELVPGIGLKPFDLSLNVEGSLGDKQFFLLNIHLRREVYFVWASA
jgi:hypothetical protein